MPVEVCNTFLFVVSDNGAGTDPRFTRLPQLLAGVNKKRVFFGINCKPIDLCQFISKFTYIK